MCNPLPLPQPLLSTLMSSSSCSSSSSTSLPGSQDRLPECNPIRGLGIPTWRFLLGWYASSYPMGFQPSWSIYWKELLRIQSRMSIFFANDYGFCTIEHHHPLYRNNICLTPIYVHSHITCIRITHMILHPKKEKETWQENQNKGIHLIKTMPNLGRLTQTNIVLDLGRSTQTMNQLFKVAYHSNIDGFGAPKMLKIQSPLLVGVFIIHR